MTMSPTASGQNLSDASLISVRALHDRIHAVSSKGVVCYFVFKEHTSIQKIERSVTQVDSFGERRATY